jgi:hypothetical protein
MKSYLIKYRLFYKRILGKRKLSPISNISSIYIFYSNMFRIVKQRREVKFRLVYAGMLDHEDSDNITNKFPIFRRVSTIRRGMAPTASPPRSRRHWLYYHNFEC